MFNIKSFVVKLTLILAERETSLFADSIALAGLLFRLV